MSKKRMLADVLWEAANKHLRSREGWDETNSSKFSCDAVALALGELGPYTKNPAVVGAMRFLRSLGLKSCESLIQFISFREGAERQGVRYMWLLLAMHVAEDEGVTV